MFGLLDTPSNDFLLKPSAGQPNGPNNLYHNQNDNHKVYHKRGSSNGHRNGSNGQKQAFSQNSWKPAKRTRVGDFSEQGPSKKRTKVINIINNYGTAKKSTTVAGTQTPPKSEKLTDVKNPNLYDNLNMLQLNDLMIKQTEDCRSKIQTFLDLGEMEPDFEQRDELFRNRIKEIFEGEFDGFEQFRRVISDSGTLTYTIFGSILTMKGKVNHNAENMLEYVWIQKFIGKYFKINI